MDQLSEFVKDPKNTDATYEIGIDSNTSTLVYIKTIDDDKQYNISNCNDDLTACNAKLTESIDCEECYIVTVSFKNGDICFHKVQKSGIIEKPIDELEKIILPETEQIPLSAMEFSNYLLDFEIPEESPREKLINQSVAMAEKVIIEEEKKKLPSPELLKEAVDIINKILENKEAEKLAETKNELVAQSVKVSDSVLLATENSKNGLVTEALKVAETVLTNTENSKNEKNLVMEALKVAETVLINTEKDMENRKNGLVTEALKVAETVLTNTEKDMKNRKNGLVTEALKVAETVLINTEKDAEDKKKLTTEAAKKIATKYLSDGVNNVTKNVDKRNIIESAVNIVKLLLENKAKEEAQKKAEVVAAQELVEKAAKEKVIIHSAITVAGQVLKTKQDEEVVRKAQELEATRKAQKLEATLKAQNEIVQSAVSIAEQVFKNKQTEEETRKAQEEIVQSAVGVSEQVFKNKQAEELKRAEELKLAEELKRTEELKRAEDQKLAEELKKAEELKRAEKEAKEKEAKEKEAKEKVIHSSITFARQVLKAKQDEESARNAATVAKKAENKTQLIAKPDPYSDSIKVVIDTVNEGFAVENNYTKDENGITNFAVEQIKKLDSYLEWFYKEPYIHKLNSIDSNNYTDIGLTSEQIMIFNKVMFFKPPDLGELTKQSSSTQATEQEKFAWLNTFQKYFEEYFPLINTQPEEKEPEKKHLLYVLNSFNNYADKTGDKNNYFIFLFMQRIFTIIDAYKDKSFYGKLTENINLNDLDSALKIKNDSYISTFIKFTDKTLLNSQYNPCFDLYLNKENTKLNFHYNLSDNNIKSLNFNNAQITSYKIGPVDQIFLPETDNKTIAEHESIKNKIVEQLVTNRQPVFLIGYGASGSGKTSSLIYYHHADEGKKDGILIHLCNNIAKRLNSGNLNLDVNVIEFYKNPVIAKDALIKDEVNLNFIWKNNKFEIKNNAQIPIRHKYRFKTEERKDYDPTGKSLGEILMHLVDLDRYVKPTTNNPNSSRSHCLILLKFTINNNIYSMAVGDFAGVENEFACDEDKVKTQFWDLKDDLFKTHVYRSFDADPIVGDEVYADSKKSEENPLKNLDEDMKRLQRSQKLDAVITNIETQIEDLTDPGEVKTEFPEYFTALYEKYAIPDDIIDRFTKMFSTPTVTMDETEFFDDAKKKRMNSKDIKDILFKLGIITEKKRNQVDAFAKSLDLDVKKLNFILFVNNIITTGNYFVVESAGKVNVKSLSIHLNNNINNIYLNEDAKISNRTKEFITKYRKNKDYTLLRKIYASLLPVNEYNTIQNAESQKTKNDSIKENNANETNKLKAQLQIFQDRKRVFEHVETICKYRVHDGKYINESLALLRQDISQSMSLKTDEVPFYSPVIDYKDISYYCPGNKDCFKMQKPGDNIAIKSDFLKEFQKFIDGKDDKTFLSNIRFSVFCVFDITYKINDNIINNPPSVPYVDINKLKLLVFNENCSLFELNLELNNQSKLIDQFRENPNYQDIVAKFVEACLSLKNSIQDNVKSTSIKAAVTDANYKTKFNALIKSIESIDNYNAASVIGTLEFTDRMSKLNTTKTIYSDKQLLTDDLKGYTSLQKRSTFYSNAEIKTFIELKKEDVDMKQARKEGDKKQAIIVEENRKATKAKADKLAKEYEDNRIAQENENKRIDEEKEATRKKNHQILLEQQQKTQMQLNGRQLTAQNLRGKRK